MKLYLKVILLTAVFIVIIKSCSPFLSVDNPLNSQLAPDFTLPTLNERQVTMSQFRNGQPAIIFFWATWCPHCRTQLKELTSNHQAIEADGIKIILVDVGESIQKVRDYIDANNISFEIFIDESTEIAKLYKIVGVPTFFFVSREGLIMDVKNALPDDYQKLLLGLVP